MPNISEILEVARALQTKAVLPLADRCVAVRNRNSKCKKCIDACLADAVEVHNNKLTVNASLCVSCGACTTVCPTEALVPLAPMDHELASKVRAARAAVAGSQGRAVEGAPDVPAVIACARMAARNEADPRMYAEVPCMARVEESLLLGLAAEGVERILLVDGVCRTCKYRATSPGTDATVDSANLLMEVQGAAPRVQRVQEFPAETLMEDARSLLGESRRSFFTGAGSFARDAAAEAADVMVLRNVGLGSKKGKEPTLRERLKAADDGTLPQFDAARRMRVLDAMYELGEPAVDEFETRLFGSVEIITEKCNACGMCTVFCPTGALVKSAVKPEDGEGSYLEFSMADCTQCGLCVDACMKKCLAVNPVVSAEELFDFEPRLIWLPKPPARSGIMNSFKK